MSQTKERLNPFQNDLEKLEQFDLWHEYEDAKRWAKSWRTIAAIFFVAMSVMLAISIHDRGQRDEKLAAANARVLAMADQLARNQRVK